MAYCESAQENCAYLDFIKELEEGVLVDGGMGKIADEGRAEVEGILDQWTANTQRGTFQCSEDACGIVKQAILRGVLIDAIRSSI